jgi:DNA-directed RNA polymerase specialized sigma24 family protein
MPDTTDRRGPGHEHSPQLRGDEAQLFAVHHAALLRAVRRAVRAPAAVIEDACASAWMILLRRQPDRGPTLFGWLRTVAIHEAYRLAAHQGTTSLERLGRAHGDGWHALVPDVRSLEQTIQARRLLAQLATLPEAQRKTLALLVAGYRYREIQRLRDATYTNVNKQLVRARRRLRDLDGDAA